MRTRDPDRTVPSREQIAAAIEAVTQNWDEPLDEVHDIPPITNAVHALLAGQPTVAEVKAQALEEAADLTDNPHEDHWLRERARQIREGEE